MKTELHLFSPQQKKIIHTWMPLAGSWMLMGVEMPLITAILTRLQNPEISLAAYGGVVFPLAMIFEAPIVMLLAASTALSKDWQAYKLLKQFMIISGFLLTTIHILLAFTPLFDIVVGQIMAIPDVLIEPSRVGLQIITPWSWAIAYRRFQQGVLIRYGHSDAVGIGTVISITVHIIVLVFGLVIGTIPGYIIGAASQACGVVAEAIYTWIRVKPVLRDQLKKEHSEKKLSWRGFLTFYIPLALTPILAFTWQPIGSAALSRMPFPIESLAIWPVITGLVFLMRSPGLAYNEVVVALAEQKGSFRHLRKFVNQLTLTLTLIHLLVAITPLAYLWFRYVSGLSPTFTELAKTGILIAIPMTVVSTLQSWYQGLILYSRKTKAIPEATLLFLITVIVILVFGVFIDRYTGLFVGLIGFSMAHIAQTIWLWKRSREVNKQIQIRDHQTEWVV